MIRGIKKKVWALMCGALICGVGTVSTANAAAIETCMFTERNTSFADIRDTIKLCGTVYVAAPITIDGEIDMSAPENYPEDLDFDAVFVLTYSDAIGDEPFVTFKDAGKIINGNVFYNISTAGQWSKWETLEEGGADSQDLFYYQNPLLQLTGEDEGYPILENEIDTNAMLSNAMTESGKLERITLTYVKPMTPEEPDAGEGDGEDSGDGQGDGDSGETSGDVKPAPTDVDDGGGGCNAGFGGALTLLAAALFGTYIKRHPEIFKD